MLYEIREIMTGNQETNERLCFVENFTQAARVLVICTQDYLDEEDVQVNRAYPCRISPSIKYMVEEFE